MALDPLNNVPVLDFIAAKSTSPEAGTRKGSSISTQRRVLVSRYSFIISSIILVIFLITLVAVYACPMDRGLPFVPTNLGATLAFVAGSEALADLKGTSGMSTKERELHLKTVNGRYYIGWGNSPAGDGKRGDVVRRYALHKEE